MKQQTLDGFRKEVDDLVATGERVVDTVSAADDEITGRRLAEVMMWVSRVGQVIKRLYPQGSSHAETFDHARRTNAFNFIHSNNCAHIVEIYGVVRAIQHEVNSSLFVDLRRLLQADIFADFLEMAGHLLGEGYKDAAAVLIGGVLEDSLRQLASSAGVPIVDQKGRPLTIDPLNVALAKAGVYTGLVQKQITSWADLRNSAAHGQYAKYGETDVKQMLEFVQRFASDHLQ